MTIRLTLLLLFVSIACVSCFEAGHEAMMRDTKTVLESEQFCDLSDETDLALQALFRFITDSVDTIVPSGCETFHLSSDNPKLVIFDTMLINQLMSGFSKLDSYHNSFVEVCHGSPNSTPRINMRVKTQKVKARSSYQSIIHVISNNTTDNSRASMEGIGGELIKMKIVNKGIRYSIGVSPEIGFFD